MLCSEKGAPRTLIACAGVAMVTINEAGGSSGCRSVACARQLSLRKASVPLLDAAVLLRPSSAGREEGTKEQSSPQELQRTVAPSRPEPVQTFRVSFLSTTKV